MVAFGQLTVEESAQGGVSVGLKEEKGIAEVSVGSVPTEFALGPDRGKGWICEWLGIDLEADLEGKGEESSGHGTCGDVSWIEGRLLGVWCVRLW